MTIPSHHSLTWPFESTIDANSHDQRWFHPGSNICLDFHGDPITAHLAVFSDGNHHMALEAALQAFQKAQPAVHNIFYATTPPGVLVNLLNTGTMHLGNLTLSRLPDIFISPPNILKQLQQAGRNESHQPFMQSQGNVLLIKKGNPKNILGIKDLLRDDVRLFISNPETEKASYDVYRETIRALAIEIGIAASEIDSRLTDTSRTYFGELIHHREAPQCLYDGRADVAMVYYHLALRYKRIFPDSFDFIPLGGNQENPQPSPGNLTTTYHIGQVDSGGEFGSVLLEFMFTDTVTKIYTAHGLRRPT